MRRKTINPSEVDLKERVIEKAVRRCAKVMKGGRRFSFSTLVVCGDEHGVVGCGCGKARDVPSAVEKAGKNARKSLERVSVVNGTIPHRIVGRYGSARVMLVPASAGTGVIACASVRAVVELAGITNLLTKSYGSRNPINLVKATLNGLRSARTRDEVAQLRGVTLE